MGAKTTVLSIAVGVIALTLASAASALTPSQIGKCTDLSGKSGLNTKKVIEGLPLEAGVVARFGRAFRNTTAWEASPDSTV